MSEEDVLRLREALLDWINGQGRPITRDELEDWARLQSYPSSVVQRAIWRLVSDSKLDFTPDWRLEAV